MKFYFLAPIVVLNSFLSYSNSESACDNLYSRVTYALSHSKKAMGATNFEHQMYYAERALTAMEKAETFTSDCSCAKAEEKSYLIKENLSKAIEPKDWDAGRFFTKKSKNLINELITVLDDCSLQNTTETTSLQLDGEAENQKENEKINDKTLKLAKYISFTEKRLKATEIEMDKLLQALNMNDPSQAESPSSAIKMQQQMYIDKTKKLLHKALKQLESTN